MMIIKKIQQIGHSMGGGIALAAAGTSPELKLSSISGHHKMFKRQIFINSTSTIFICANIQICNMLTFFVQFSSQISSVFWLEGALRIRRFLFLFSSLEFMHNGSSPWQNLQPDHLLMSKSRSCFWCCVYLAIFDSFSQGAEPSIEIL